MAAQKSELARMIGPRWQLFYHRGKRGEIKRNIIIGDRMIERERKSQREKEK